MTRPDDRPAFHVMAKPTGARCNMNCAYCFFLKKANLYPGSDFTMSDELMEMYIKQTIEAHRIPRVTIAWQGGEPTLMGVDFYRRAMAVEKKYARPGMTFENTIQTNGTLIDEEWCRFLKENNFLVGLSLDGPEKYHDMYRLDKAGKSVFKRVVKAAELMQEWGVEFNILCTVNSANSRHPLEVYHFFRDEMKTPYLQFIPIVERDNETGNQEGTKLTNRTVDPDQYGRFLNTIFDEWVRNDVGSMFIQMFDATLASWIRGYSSICIFRPTCGDGVALEHNGDVYSCDHFVEPAHLLGNITETPVGELVRSEKQLAFGRAKSEILPRYCRECEYLFACNGECPKNRVLKTPDGETGLNWLCSGLKAFFSHTARPMQIMGELLKKGHYADEVMEILAMEERSDATPLHKQV